MNEVETGYEDFDHRFLVRTNDGDLAKAFLSEGVRWQLDRLCSFLASDEAARISGQVIAVDGHTETLAVGLES